MSTVRITRQQFRQLIGEPPAPKARREKPFKLSAAEPKKKHRSAAEWLAVFRATPPRPAETRGQAEAQRALFEVRDEVVYRLWLPLAPSNNALKQVRGGIVEGKVKAWMAPTAVAEAYPIAVQEAWQRMWNGRPPKPLTDRVRLLIVVHPPREGSDIFNREKALSDALTACGVWVDDKQIDDGRVLRGRIIPETGAMDVTIETIT